MRDIKQFYIVVSSIWTNHDYFVVCNGLYDNLDDAFNKCDIVVQNVTDLNEVSIIMITFNYNGYLIRDVYTRQIARN